nr:DUF3261 domain-containing protein [Aliidiomarina indica]
MVAYEGGYFQIAHSWPNADIQWTQHAVIEFGNERQELLLSSLFTQEKLVVVALTLTGQELFRVRVEQNTLEVLGGDTLPDPRLPLRMVVEMQLALLPESTLERQMRGGLRIRQDDHGEWRRHIYNENERVLTISADEHPLQAQAIKIKHTEYHLTITTLDREIMETSNE